MYEVKVNFKEFPGSLKKGLLLEVIAWAWHYLTLYVFLSVDESPIRQIFIGVGICVVVFLVIAWGRILCMIFNAAIVLIYLAVTYTLHQKGIATPKYVIVTALNVVLFSAATYFLAVKETSSFFKKQTQKLADKRAEAIKTHMEQADKRKEEVMKLKAQREEVKKRQKG